MITAPGATASAQTAVTANGGTVFAVYDAIGVIVAHSTSSISLPPCAASAGV